MLEIEHAMATSAERMGQSSSHGVNRHHVDRALSLQDDAIWARTTASLSGKVEGGNMLLVDRERGDRRGSSLSEEQRVAVRHVTGPAQIATVIGFAGAGKSTMLAAASRCVEERQGYRGSWCGIGG